MNELNYASLEASQKLYEAGIVLETEVVWARDEIGWYLRSSFENTEREVLKSYPAPSVTELLREMPTETSVEKTDDGYIVPAWKWNRYYCNENPADALIEFWVWLKEQNREGGRP